MCIVTRHDARQEALHVLLVQQQQRTSTAWRTWSFAVTKDSFQSSVMVIIAFRTALQTYSDDLAHMHLTSAKLHDVADFVAFDKVVVVGKGAPDVRHILEGLLWTQCFSNCWQCSVA